MFYITSEVDNIYISWVAKHLNFLFTIYKFPIIFQGKEKRILLYISFCFDFLVGADEFIKALSFIKLLSDSDFLFTFP